MGVLAHAQMRSTTDRGTLLAQVATTLAPETTQAAPRKENGMVIGVELRGLEPLTPTLPGRVDQVRSGSLRSRKPLHLLL